MNKLLRFKNKTFYVQKNKGIKQYEEGKEFEECASLGQD